MVQSVKNPPAMREIWVQSLGWEDPLEKGTATHSSMLAWRIPWTIQSMSRTRRVSESFESDTTEQLSLSGVGVLTPLNVISLTFGNQN